MVQMVLMEGPFIGLRTHENRNTPHCGGSSITVVFISLSADFNACVDMPPTPNLGGNTPEPEATTRRTVLQGQQDFYAIQELVVTAVFIPPGKRVKTEAMYCPARFAAYGDGDTSDLVLDCGGTVS